MPVLQITALPPWVIVVFLKALTAQPWAYHKKPWNNFPVNWKLDGFPLCQNFLKQIFTRGCANALPHCPLLSQYFECLFGLPCVDVSQATVVGWNKRSGKKKTPMNAGYFLQKRGRKWFICFNLNILHLFHYVPSRWFLPLYSLSLITRKVLFYLETA